jgi:predicted CXXCH cytochrome family protein
MPAKKTFAVVVFLCIAASSGCSYRYFLGVHGPSIKKSPDIHQTFREDGQCLDCHSPDKAQEAPPTSHPGFKGCLKCHNNDIK